MKAWSHRACQQRTSCFAPPSFWQTPKECKIRCRKKKGGEKPKCKCSDSRWGQAVHLIFPRGVVCVGWMEILCQKWQAKPLIFFFDVGKPHVRRQMKKQMWFRGQHATLWCKIKMPYKVGVFSTLLHIHVFTFWTSSLFLWLVDLLHFCSLGKLSSNCSNRPATIEDLICPRDSHAPSIIGRCYAPHVSVFCLPLYCLLIGVFLI